MENSKSYNLDQVTDNRFNKLTKVLFGIGFISLIASLILFSSDTHYFFFSYLTVFCFFLTVSLGGMFIVLIQYITSAGWSVVVRRVPELLMKNITLLIFLSIPLFFGLKDLYHWTHLEEVLHDHLLQIKRPYLNVPFFIIRMILYFSIWSWISNTFFKLSTEQDETKDPEITNQLQKSSTYSMILFGLTLTFAFIDLVMSLTSHWYSTIFGVYMFAGSVLIGFCFTSLIYMLLRKYGFLKSVVTIEHFHDLGKLIYGFNIFWAYIAFCQFFLIWYANVPEETVFYAKHFAGSWNTVAIFLSVGHFGIPFIFFMSRVVKRNLKWHAIIVVWIVLMHFLDLFWIIMPNVSKYNFSIKPIDIILFIGFGAIYFANFFRNLNKVNLVPKGDPRLKESLSFVNF